MYLTVGDFIEYQALKSWQNHLKHEVQKPVAYIFSKEIKVSGNSQILLI